MNNTLCLQSARGLYQHLPLCSICTQYQHVLPRISSYRTAIVDPTAFCHLSPLSAQHVEPQCLHPNSTLTPPQLHPNSSPTPSHEATIKGHSKGNKKLGRTNKKSEPYEGQCPLQKCPVIALQRYRCCNEYFFSLNTGLTQIGRKADFSINLSFSGLFIPYRSLGFVTDQYLFRADNLNVRIIQSPPQLPQHSQADCTWQH